MAEEESSMLKEETDKPSYSELESGEDPGKEQTMKLPVLPVDVLGLGKLGNDIRDAKAAAPSAAAFGASCFSICCASACCSILSLVLSAMPLIMLIVGVLYIGKCKEDPMIPIWLVVFGSVGLFQSVLNLCKSITENMTDESSKSSREGFQMAANIIGSILSFFLFVWILAGSIWVFGFYSKFQANQCSSHGNDAECCHPVPYYFSLFILLSMYTFGALSLILVCCCFWCCLCAVK